MADFFISYTEADVEQAQAVADALKGAGLTVSIASLDVVSGDNFIRWMRTELAAAQNCIAICSPAYLSMDRSFVQAEIDTALAQNAKHPSFGVIPVKVLPCDIPVWLSNFVFFDLTRRPIADFVAEQVTRRGGHLPQATGKGRKAGLMIGFFHGPSVVGREKDIENLRLALNAEGEVQITNSKAILKGQGGIGKSTLARAYAERHQHDYDGLLWVNAESRQSIIDGLMDLAPMLGLEVPETAREAHAKTVLARLDQSGQDWLVIYDNVEGYDTFKHLEPRRAHLIATTRQGEGWPGFTVQDTDVLDVSSEDSPGVKLLIAQAGVEDSGKEGTGSAALSLAQALGGLPLALSLTGAMVKSQGMSFGEAETKIAEIIAAEPKNADYPDSVIGAVRLSYKALSDDAKEVANLFAWWGTEGLGAGLLTDAPRGALYWNVSPGVSGPLQALAVDAARVDAGIAGLVDRSLLTIGASGFSMHRMASAALRAMQASAPYSESAAALLASVCPEEHFSPANWPQYRRLVPHVRALLASAPDLTTPSMGYLLNQCAIFSSTVGDGEDAVLFARASLAISRKQVHESHVNVAIGHSALGRALIMVGRLDEAAEELDRAIVLAQTYHPDREDLAHFHDLKGEILLRKARIVEERGAYVLALRERQRAAAIFRRRVSPGQFPRDLILGNIADVRLALGQPRAGLRLYGYSLAIRRAAMAPHDARLVSALVNVARTWYGMRAFPQAEPIFEEVVDMARQGVVDPALQHEVIMSAAMLTGCYLIRARAGEDAEARTAKARQICVEFNFDFAEVSAEADKVSYDPH